MNFLILALFVAFGILLYLKSNKVPSSGNSPSVPSSGFIPEGEGEGTGDGSVTPPTGPAAE